MPPRSREPAPPPATSAIALRRAAAREEGSASYIVRRREIVAAAAEVFKQKGLQRSNLGDVAAVAGVDRASLYYYVESKEELFHEVVQEAVEANLAQARAIRDGDGTAPEKLRTLVQALMRSYAEHYPILYVYIQENLSHVPDQHTTWAADMRRINKEYERVLIDIIESGLRDGHIRPVAPAWLIAYGLLGMLGWTNRWFNPEDATLSADEIGAAFADTLLGGLQGTGAEPSAAPSRFRLSRARAKQVVDDDH